MAPIIEFFLQLVAMERFLVAQMSLRTKRHDTTGAPVVCRLWTKPQTCRLSRFFILLQLDRFTADGSLLQPTGGVNTTPHTSIFAVCLQGILVQNKFGALKTSKLVSWHTERQAQQCVK